MIMALILRLLSPTKTVPLETPTDSDNSRAEPPAQRAVPVLHTTASTRENIAAQNRNAAPRSPHGPVSLNGKAPGAASNPRDGVAGGRARQIRRAQAADQQRIKQKEAEQASVIYARALVEFTLLGLPEAAEDRKPMAEVDQLVRELSHVKADYSGSMVADLVRPLVQLLREPNVFSAEAHQAISGQLFRLIAEYRNDAGMPQALDDLIGSGGQEDPISQLIGEARHAADAIGEQLVRLTPRLSIDEHCRIVGNCLDQAQALVAAFPHEEGASVPDLAARLMRRYFAALPPGTLLPRLDAKQRADRCEVMAYTSKLEELLASRHAMLPERQFAETVMALLELTPSSGSIPEDAVLDRFAALAAAGGAPPSQRLACQHLRQLRQSLRDAFQKGEATAVCRGVRDAANEAMAALHHLGQDDGLAAELVEAQVARVLGAMEPAAVARLRDRLIGAGAPDALARWNGLDPDQLVEPFARFDQNAAVSAFKSAAQVWRDSFGRVVAKLCGDKPASAHGEGGLPGASLLDEGFGIALDKHTGAVASVQKAPFYVCDRGPAQRGIMVHGVVRGEAFDNINETFARVDARGEFQTVVEYRTAGASPHGADCGDTRSWVVNRKLLKDLPRCLSLRVGDVVLSAEELDKEPLGKAQLGNVGETLDIAALQGNCPTLTAKLRSMLETLKGFCMRSSSGKDEFDQEQFLAVTTALSQYSLQPVSGHATYLTELPWFGDVYIVGGGGEANPTYQCDRVKDGIRVKAENSDVPLNLMVGRREVPLDRALSVRYMRTDIDSRPGGAHHAVEDGSCYAAILVEAPRHGDLRGAA